MKEKPSERLKKVFEETHQNTEVIIEIGTILDELFERVENLEKTKVRHCSECLGTGECEFEVRDNYGERKTKKDTCDYCQGSGHVIIN